MELGTRLSAVADMILPAEVFADVGCDHGYLSVYLIEQKKCNRMVAMDVRKGPLERAERTIQRYGCTGQIDTRLSDGIRKLKIGEAEGFVCAGMGGRLALQILFQDKEKVAVMKQVVLQPQSELWLVRRMLSVWGMCIEEERMVFEEGKFYTMMRIKPATSFKEAQPITQDCFLTGFHQSAWRRYAGELYGSALLDSKDYVLKEFMGKELIRLTNIREELSGRIPRENPPKRFIELEQEIYILQQALSYYFGE